MDELGVDIIDTVMWYLLIFSILILGSCAVSLKIEQMKKKPIIIENNVDKQNIKAQNNP